MIAWVLLPLLTQLACAHDPAEYQIDGSGTTNPSKFFWKIMEQFQVRTIEDVRLTYRAVGSSYGQAEFTQKADGDFSGSLNNFGAGDIPMDQGLYDSLTGVGREMVHVPFCLGAIAIFHSIPAAEMGTGDLKLSPCVLAKIFDGVITEWSDAEIMNDNPDLKIPAGTKIQVGHRTTGSSSTGGTTGYLQAKCPASWNRGAAASISWPTLDSFTSVEGSPGMLAHLTSTPYAIGYLDAGHGHGRNLPEVALKNEADAWLTSRQAMAAGGSPSANGIAMAGDAAVSAGDIPTDVTASWASVNLYRKAGATTWPIVLVSYIYLNKDWSSLSATKAGLLKAFVDYVTGTKGQELLSEFSFNALPAAMNRWSETWTNVITKPGTVTSFTFEESKARWTGQGNNVISVKRDSYTMWKVGDLDSSVTDMETRLQSVESAPLGVQVDGSGTTNPSKFFWKIMESFQARTKENIRLTYRAVGSSYGQAEFSQRSDGDFSGSLNDFGAGDIPMDSGLYASLTGAGRSMVHVPFCLGAIAIFHSIPKAMLGTGDLKLSPCVLAEIFDGVITEWTDAKIIADNPNLKVPAGTQIQVGHRTTGSSSTGGTTGYLRAKCPASWNRGAAASISWPTLDTFTSVEGSPGMTAHIANTPYAIGYLDAGHGHQRGFSEVALKNEADNWLTSTQAMNAGGSPSANGIAAAGAAAVAAGDIPSDVTASWSDVNLYGKGGATTWPIVLVSYIYVNKDWSGMSANRAGLLKAFVDYVTGPEGQGMLGEFSFNALPAAMNKWTETWTNVITHPVAVAEFTFEESKMRWAGMGDQVISVKRDSYSMWKIGEMAADIADVQARLSSLESVPRSIQVDGSGTTNPSKFFWKIMETMQGRTKENMRLTYRAVGSSYGQAEFTQKSDGDFSGSLNDFGAGDIPMAQNLYDSLTSAGRQMVHVPFSLGAIAVFHSVPKTMLGSGDLKLPPCVLAKIFDGQITTWDHQEIKNENPGLTVPFGMQIQVGHRTTGSSSTGGITGYLQAKCPASWNRGAGSKITWPSLPTFTSVEGSPGMTAHITDTPFAIGYLDAGHGHQRGFSEVALKNEADNWLTSSQAIASGSSPAQNGIAAAGAAGVASGAVPSDVTQSWATVDLYGKDGAMTWPIVLVSYIYVSKDWSRLSADKAGALKAFVDFVTGPAGQGMLNEFSFNAIPAAMNKWTETWSNVIDKPAAVTDFSFEESKMKWTGQDDKVISVKRDTYSMWKIGEMATELEDIKTSLSRLETAPTGGGAQVDGSGTTNPSKFFWKVMETFQARSKMEMRLSYRAVGSSYGQAEFTQVSEGDFSGGLNDFGAGDIPMEAGLYQSLKDVGREMVHVPFCLGAIAIFHSIPQSNLGGYTLQLSPCVLAKIFDGQITDWDDSEIANDNPNLNVPAGTKIQVGHRTTGSSSTGGTTGYLHAKCPESWGRGAAAKITWPSLSTFTSVEGSPGMTAHIADTPFAIGYLDAGHGHQRGFSEVALKNEAGNWLTSRQAIDSGSSPAENGIASAGAAAVAAGDIPMDVTASWSDVNLYRKGGGMTWPIVLVSYIYVHKDWSSLSAERAGLLKAFVDHVTGAEGQSMLSEFSFNALPAAMNKWSETWSTVIVKPPAVTSYTFENNKMKWLGQGDQVISVKRDSYSMWKLNELDLAVQALQAASGGSSSTPSPTPAPNLNMAPAVGPAPSSNDDDDDGSSTIALVLAIVACVLGILALIISCLAFGKLRKAGLTSA